MARRHGSIEDALLRAYEPVCVSRGRQYALEGRVTQLEETARGFAAVVTGEQRYRVRLERGAKAGAEPVTACTCPRYADRGRCKHVAAVAWALSVRSSSAGARRAREELPTSLSEVYSTAKFFARLALYAKRPFKEHESYVPLGDWWWGDEGDDNAELRKHLLTHVEEIEAVFSTLRTYQPRPLESSGGFARLYGRIADTYRDRIANVRLRGPLPGPLDRRHPGFMFGYHAKRRIFEVRERPSPLLKEPLHLGLQLPLGEAEGALVFEDKALQTYETDAWEIFALHAMLEGLYAGEDPAVQELARDFERPGWERVLEHLSLEEVAPVQPREWAFCLEGPSRQPREYALSAFARPSGGGRGAKWKRQKFEALLTEPVALPLEHEIARCALFAPDRGQNRETRFTLGTAYGHELLRLLARHPRVLRAQPWQQPAPETDPPARITAGLVTMSIGPRRHGLFRPEFRVDGEPLQLRVATIPGERSALFRYVEDAGHLVSLEIPPALRSWFATAGNLGRGLAFPAEAMAKLASATEPLVAAGLVELPRAALGEELPYQPEPALRVEWKTEGSDVRAVLEVMIRPHPSAPFVATGSGAATFTFEADGRRAFVERDPRRELQIAGTAVDAIDAPLLWDQGVGRTDTIHDAIDLARWLERNPLGLPIEVKVGRAPAVHELGQKGNLVARKIGAWLRIDGSFDVAGLKVTLGEMLEAARHAQRYLRVGSGVFLELSKEAMTKLKTLALATTLAPPALAGETDGAVLHDGFGALLAQVSELFERVETTGFDLREYAERFERTRRARVRVPALEHGKLRDYQREGVDWMLRLAGWAPGCVLADDMGLGKTVQTAAVLKARAKLGPALVVAPASVSSNWVAELARFMPSLRVRWFNEERSAGLGDLGPGDVLVVSYGLLLRESAGFRELSWSTVVVDEAQYVKNIEAQRSDAVRNLRRDFTIALTGTPLENHLGELYSIVDIAFPGLLGDEASFREYFRRPIEVHRDTERLGALGALVGPFLLRRTRASVLLELPPREEITEHVELSEAERRRYLALRNAIEKALEKQPKGTPSQFDIALLAALTRLRQMACAVRLVDPEFDGPSSKITRVVELVQQIVAEGNRVLVFSQFTAFLELVEKAFADGGLRVAHLSGKTPTVARRQIIDAFQNGDFDVFCISLLAGGTGLNLTRASYVIHLDPWWNPAVEEQATARAHRMGQSDPVTVYRMVARGTIEEAVLEMHADKRDLATAVLEGKGSPKKLSSAELLELLRYGG